MSLSALYYNCSDPVQILRNQVIVPSDVHSGVSMSSWSQLGSHGPFKIHFRHSAWFSKLIRVMYWEIYHPPLRRKGQPPISPAYYAKDDMGLAYSFEAYEYFRHDYLVKYGRDIMHRVWRRNLMFSTEREWYCPHGIGFDAHDVVGIVYMENAPRVISTRKLNVAIRELKEKYPGKFRIANVMDPYLKGEV